MRKKSHEKNRKILSQVNIEITLRLYSQNLGTKTLKNVGGVVFLVKRADKNLQSEIIMILSLFGDIFGLK